MRNMGVKDVDVAREWLCVIANKNVEREGSGGSSLLISVNSAGYLATGNTRG
jgi:hypothetical protein